MSEPFLGQIEIFGFGFAPKYWAICAGQTLAISQNSALFALLGTTYGGDGQRTFGLPDLRGRLPVGTTPPQVQQQWTIGQTGGEETHTPQAAEFPGHTHTLMASANTTTTTNTDVAAPNVGLGVTTGVDAGGTSFPMPIYVSDANPNVTAHKNAIGITGGQPHENRMPYLALNFCIALNGIFPSRN